MNSAILNSMSAYLPIFVLISLRIGIMFSVMQGPFGMQVPSVVKALLSLFISLALTVTFGNPAATDLTQVLNFFSAAIGELLVGVVIGLTVRVTLASVEIAGSAIGISMAMGFAGTVDPNLGESALPTTRLLSMVATVIFLSFGGIHAMLEALAASVMVAPPGAVLQHFAWDRLLNIGSNMLAQGLRIALPVIATMFVLKVGLGLVSRIAPRVQVMMLTFAATSAVGMASLHRATPHTVYAIARLVNKLPSSLEGVLLGN